MYKGGENMKEPELDPRDLITAWNALTGEEDVIIQIRRTEEFITTAQAVSDFLKDLPLTREQNDRLISLMVEHVRAAEQGGFRDGVRYGIVFGRHWEDLQGE